NKIAAMDSDSDEEDMAQMRQFMEAADHTLLNNNMFQKPATDLTKTSKHVSSSTVAGAATVGAPLQELPKSERYLDEHKSSGDADLQITEHMQTHIWKKLGAIIEKQIKFVAPKPAPLEENTTTNPSNVLLLSGADCFIQLETPEEKLPTKKPKIKRRRLEEDAPITNAALAGVVVSGDVILRGEDMQHWQQRKPKKNKLFEYKSCDTEGRNLQAIEPTNEFTALRLKNQWDESKICKKCKKKNKI
ncbi:hypothetical protein KR215_012267, partial [Drosophila sulfurigaster]